LEEYYTSYGGANMPSYEGHWRHLAIASELVLAWAHPSLQPKRQLDSFSRFCTDDHRVSLYFTMGRPFPLSKLPLPMGICINPI